MGQRRAEEGQDAVAQELGDRALVAVDGLAHTLVGAGDDLAPVLRVHRLGQRRRADDVGEEGGDALALSFHPLPIGQDFVGDSRRGGAAQIVEVPAARHVRRRRGTGALVEAAVTAEAGAGRDRLAAIRAGPLQRLTAVLAEASIVRVGEAAVGTVHGSILADVVVMLGYSSVRPGW